MTKIYDYKNIKIRSRLHSQIKIISESTGINIGKLAEISIQKIIDDYNNGEFDKLKDLYTKIRHDGTLSRGK